MKPKGIIHDHEQMLADFTLLNGETGLRAFKAPMQMIHYQEAEEAKEYCKKQRFKFWVKLEDAEFSRVEEQMNPKLKEMSIWLDDDEVILLTGFLLPIATKIINERRSK